MGLIQESHDYERGGTQKDEYTEDEVVFVPCPLCESDERERVYTEHGSVGVSRCSSCGLLYTSPRIRAPEQIYWGDADKYYAEARLVFEGKAPHHRDPNYREELEMIRKFKPAGRFLDVGCNMGMLLRLATKMGWEAVGLEPSPSLSRLAREKVGLTVHNCFLHEMPETESFEVIALSDVFEHITEPLSFLQAVRKRLTTDGIVYLKVPNGRWSLFKQRTLAMMGRAPRQGVWDAYEHVVHYTDGTLQRMLERAGFDVVRLSIGKPIQTPVWHEFVGHYYQYPSPWMLDWKRRTGRTLFYWLSRLERMFRLGSVGYLAPNIVAVARSMRQSMK